DFPFLREPYTKSECSQGPNGAPQCVSKFELPSDPIERVVDLGLSAPRLWPITDKLRAGIDLIHERALRPSYSLTKYSAQASVDMAKNRPVAAGVQYEGGYQSFGTFATVRECVADIDRRPSRLPSGDTLCGPLPPAAALH